MTYDESLGLRVAKENKTIFGLRAAENCGNIYGIQLFKK